MSCVYPSIPRILNSSYRIKIIKLSTYKIALLVTILSILTKPLILYSLFFISVQSKRKFQNKGKYELQNIWHFFLKKLLSVYYEKDTTKFFMYILRETVRPRWVSAKLALSLDLRHPKLWDYCIFISFFLYCIGIIGDNLKQCFGQVLDTLFRNLIVLYSFYICMLLTEKLMSP